MKIVKRIKDNVLSVSVAIHQLRGAAVKSLLILPLALLSKEAAAGESIFEKFNTLAEGLASTQPGVIKGVKVFGIVIIIAGLIALWLKNKRGKDISGGYIFWSMVVGACLVGVTAYIDSVGSTIGVDTTL